MIDARAYWLPDLAPYPLTYCYNVEAECEELSYATVTSLPSPRFHQKWNLLSFNPTIHIEIFSALARLGTSAIPIRQTDLK